MTPSFSLYIDGINPEPWRSPTIARNRAFKDNNLRAYQAAVAESVADAMVEMDLVAPVFASGIGLDVSFYFWRQLDTYHTGTKRARRNAADVTNMVKSTEDALQGLVYANDRSNRRIAGEVVAVGHDVEPGILVIATPYCGGPESDRWRDNAKQRGRVDRSKTVYIYVEPNG